MGKKLISAADSVSGGKEILSNPSHHKAKGRCVTNSQLDGKDSVSGGKEILSNPSHHKAKGVCVTNSQLDGKDSVSSNSLSKNKNARSKDLSLEDNKNFLLHDKKIIKKSCAALKKKHAPIKKLLSLTGPPPPVSRAYKGFASFADILISQQISKAAANSINKKFLSLVGEATPKNILRHSPDELRGVGLSWQKIERLQLLATATIEGRFRPDDLKHYPTEEVISHIVAQKGFGEWSGEIFALFSLGRLNVFPKGDLALQLGHQHLYRLKKPLTAKELEKKSLVWQPYRSVVALLLWQYYDKMVRSAAKEQLAKNPVIKVMKKRKTK